MNRTRIVIVAAVARNGVIGVRGALPWGRFPEDLAHFRNLTTGGTVVMGRRTWESLPNAHRPLHGRQNIVVSRTLPEGGAPGADVVRSLQEVLVLLPDLPMLYVIGGAELYAAALPMADELVLTEIDRDYPGDARFPRRWGAMRWRFDKAACDEHRMSDGTRYAFVTYERAPRRAHWSDEIHWREGRWDDMSTAPRDTTEIRGKTAEGRLLEPMHYACGGGEEQPAFDGWFMPYESSDGYYEVRPVAWQPLRALPEGMDCATCPKLPKDCCRRAEGV